MILSIARKELKSMFASPMGWIILALADVCVWYLLPEWCE